MKLKRRTKRKGYYRLEGYDTFSNESYPLSSKGYFHSYAKALAAAKEHLADLERTQPTATSGGQHFGGIQDRVCIVHPGGLYERVF